MNSPEKLHVRSANLSWRRVGDEVVVLDLDDTVYLTLNHTGAVLWEALAKGATRDELIDGLVSSFSIERRVAAADVDNFLEKCRSERLLAE